jgi:hypothetical protein
LEKAAPALRGGLFAGLLIFPLLDFSAKASRRRSNFLV